MIEKRNTLPDSSSSSSKKKRENVCSKKPSSVLKTRTRRLFRSSRARKREKLISVKKKKSKGIDRFFCIFRLFVRYLRISLQRVMSSPGRFVWQSKQLIRISSSSSSSSRSPSFETLVRLTMSRMIIMTTTMTSRY